MTSEKLNKTKKYFISTRAEKLNMPYDDNNSQKILEVINNVMLNHRPTSNDELLDLIERDGFMLRIDPTTLNLIGQSYWRGYGRGLKQLVLQNDNKDLR